MNLSLTGVGSAEIQLRRQRLTDSVCMLYGKDVDLRN